MIDCSKATREELVQAVELLTKKYNQASEELKKYRWIPISERAPVREDFFYREVSNEWCLFIIRNGDEPDIFYTRILDDNKEYFEDCGITHWMPVQEVK